MFILLTHIHHPTIYPHHSVVPFALIFMSVPELVNMLTVILVKSGEPKPYFRQAEPVDGLAVGKCLYWL